MPIIITKTKVGAVTTITDGITTCKFTDDAILQWRLIVNAAIQGLI